MADYSLTNSAPCLSLPFTRSTPYVVIATPTDVNWAVLRPEAGLLSSHESDIVGRSYAVVRELSDAMSALLYNLDITITLQAKSHQQAWNLSLEVQNTVGVHEHVNVADAYIGGEVNECHGRAQHASLEGGLNHLY
jgi:hypothetical protein